MGETNKTRYFIHRLLTDGYFFIKTNDNLVYRKRKKKKSNELSFIYTKSDFLLNSNVREISAEELALIDI